MWCINNSIFIWLMNYGQISPLASVLKIGYYSFEWRMSVFLYFFSFDLLILSVFTYSTKKFIHNLLWWNNSTLRRCAQKFVHATNKSWLKSFLCFSWFVYICEMSSIYFVLLDEIRCNRIWYWSWKKQKKVSVFSGKSSIHPAKVAAIARWMSGPIQQRPKWLRWVCNVTYTLVHEFINKMFAL